MNKLNKTNMGAKTIEAAVLYIELQKELSMQRKNVPTAIRYPDDERLKVYRNRCERLFEGV